ncbi:MAG: PA14 domain-containing protein [Flavobacterium sp.]
MKAQITSSVYTFNSGDYANHLLRSSNGDFYFSINQQLQKLSSNGVITNIANLNNYPYGLALDGFNNIYYFSYNTGSIQKVFPDGTITTFLSGINSAENLKIDNFGNLFFTNYDNDTGQQSIKKVTPDGTTTSFVTGNGYYYSLTIDYAGNLYFSNGNSIQKVTPDGIVSNYVTGNFYPYNMTFDSEGNLYFIDYNNSPPNIKKVTPNGAAQVYLENDVNLSQPNGLVSDSTGILYYINSNYSNNNYTSQIIKVSLPCAQPSIPIASDQSFEDAATITNLVAIGDNIKWYKTPTGGISLISATVLTSGTYYVTQTVNDCESNRIPVVITINKMGLNAYGQRTSNKSTQVTKNGAINANSFVNSYGKSTNNISLGNGELNYEIFTAPASHPSSSNEFSSYVNPSNLTSSGTNSASLLLNWENSGTLTNAAIAIPNGGNQFAVQVSGFFIPQESGIYTFTCEGDDAVDLFINDVNVANHYGGHGIGGLGSHIGTIELVAGESYSFRARMQENGGGEGLRVFWRKPSESSGWNIYTNELSTSN